MHRPLAWRLLLVCLTALLLAGCNRDPNVRKQKYFDSGESYFAEGKYREAAIQYSNAIQIDSRFAQAHYQLGETFLKLGDTQHGYQELLRTVELAPENYRAQMDLANLLITARNPDGSPRTDSLTQAKTHLDLLREREPNAAETHEAWSNYYAAQNNLNPAIQEMQQAIAIDPNRPDSYMVLAILQLRAGQTDKSEASFKKAVEVDPKSMNAQLALGGFYQSRNRLPEAEQQFRHAITVDPKAAGPRAALVRVLMQEGKRGDAEALLEQTRKDLANDSEGYRMLGDFYFANGDLDKATAEYASLYNDHSKDPFVRKNYIQLLILKNRLVEAAKLNSDILKSAPRDVDALIDQGQIELRLHHTEAAIDALQNALRNDPDNAIAHYHLGLAYDQQHDASRAESEWRDAVRLRPDLTDAQRELAAVEMRRNNFAALLDIAQQVIKYQPNAPDGYQVKSVAELGLQQYRQAQLDALEAEQRAPQNPAPYVQIGKIELAQKELSEAEKSFAMALDKDPASSDALSGLMNTYVAQNQYDKAIAAARAQIAKAPGNSNFYDLLGTALFQGKKDFAGAEFALQRAVNLDKNNTDAAEKLGKVEIQQGHPDQALALYQQSIKDNPGEIRFYLLCGALYESQHDWDHAKIMYQQALSLQPDQAVASNNLAYVMLEQGGNVDVALAMAESARRSMPDWPNAADTLGWAYYQKGIYQSAINQFQEALRLDEKGGVPEDAVVHYHLGLAYEKANQNALARQHLEKALKLSPNNADAKKALSELRG
jgi:cellulose synthase operon protein C